MSKAMNRDRESCEIMREFFSQAPAAEILKYINGSCLPGNSDDSLPFMKARSLMESLVRILAEIRDKGLSFPLTDMSNVRGMHLEKGAAGKDFIFMLRDSLTPAACVSLAYPLKNPWRTRPDNDEPMTDQWEECDAVARVAGKPLLNVFRAALSSLNYNPAGKSPCNQEDFVRQFSDIQACYHNIHILCSVLEQMGFDKAQDLPDSETREEKQAFSGMMASGMGRPLEGCPRALASRPNPLQDRSGGRQSGEMIRKFLNRASASEIMSFLKICCLPGEEGGNSVFEQKAEAFLAALVPVLTQIRDKGLSLPLTDMSGVSEFSMEKGKSGGDFLCMLRDYLHSPACVSLVHPLKNPGRTKPEDSEEPNDQWEECDAVARVVDADLLDDLKAALCSLNYNSAQRPREQQAFLDQFGYANGYYNNIYRLCSEMRNHLTE